jgi:heat shock protein HtpX
VLLLSGFGLVAGAVVWLVVAAAGWPIAGLIVGVLVATAAAVWAARSSERVVLRQVGARPADPVADARFINLVDGLCSASGVPRPTLLVLDHPARNALATARSQRHATLVATSGLLDALSRIELEGVVAHELSRVKSGDAELSTVVAGTAGMVLAGCDWGFGVSGRASGANGGPRVIVGWVLAGPAVLAAQLVRRGIDPEREAAADLATARLTRYPPGLLAALEKVAAADAEVPRLHGVAHLWLRSPLSRPAPPGWRLGFLDRVLATGDSLPARIETLREL